MFPFSAEAKDQKLIHPHADFCKGTSSTASALKCLSSHKKIAEKALKKASDELIKNRDEKTRKNFIETQNSWLTYRDQECAWEKNLVEGKVAKRLYEASCLASLTDTRAKQLSYALESSMGEDVIPELESTPRWMNSAFSDYPNVYWTQKKNISVDLDCDGRDEEIMTGISYAQDKETQKYDLSVNLLVAMNPAVGKPKIERFQLPVVRKFDEKSGNVICSPDFSVTSFDEVVDKKVSEEVCNKALKITSKNQGVTCPELVLKLKDKNFTLQPLAEGKI